MKKIAKGFFAVILSCVVIFGMFIFAVNATQSFMWAKSDSIMRSEAGQNGSITRLIIKGIKLEVINQDPKIINGTRYLLVKIASGQTAYYETQAQGWMLARQLQNTSTAIPPSSERNMTITQQRLVIQAAEKIWVERANRLAAGNNVRYALWEDPNSHFNVAVTYPPNITLPSNTIPNNAVKSYKADFRRWSGFHNIMLPNSNGTLRYYYDCSSFVSAVFKNAGTNSSFSGKNTNLIRNANSPVGYGYKVKYNNKEYALPWRVYDYKKDSDNQTIFRKVKKVTTAGASIPVSDLMAGDVILTERKNGSHHVLLYMGDDYVFHSTANGMVKERLSFKKADADFPPKDRFLKVASNAVGFDQAITILRFKGR